MLFGLAAATVSQQTRADSATPIAEESPTDTPTGTPRSVATETSTSAPTDTATSTATLTATTAPTNTSTPVPSKTATRPAVKAQSVSTGSIKVAPVDASGNPLSQSCVQYAQPFTANSATLCDGVPSLSGTSSDDGDPDGFIEIPNLAAGSWILQGSDPLDSISPAPLPAPADVIAGQTSNVQIVFHAYGELDVTLDGVAGQTVSACAYLYLDNYPIYGSGFLASKIATKCDADDGSRDGVVKFTELAVGG